MIPSMAHGHSHGGHGHGHVHAQEKYAFIYLLFLIYKFSEPLAVETKDSNCCMTGAVVPTAPSQTVPVVTKPAFYPIDAESAYFDSFLKYLFSVEHSEPMLPNETTSDGEVAGHCQKHCPLTVHSRRTASGRNSPECGAPASTE